MRSGKANHEQQQQYDDDEDDFSSRKEGPSSDSTSNIIVTTKEGKSNDQKANAIRSKHSVTEQRRRSKINERFQILRDLIPHSDQKRDTASFLVEVIEYVRYLQEKVTKYEAGPYQSWNLEPTKLMPWRNSHLRGQSLGGQLHPSGTCSGGAGPAYAGTIDESIIITPAMFTNAQAPVDSDHGGDATCRQISQLQQLANKGHAHPLQRPVSDAQSSDNPSTGEGLNRHDDLMIEGGTISISSVYSQELLNNLTQALENAGVDLSQANISVQVDLGKRANMQQNSETLPAQNHENPPSSNQTLIHPRAVNNKDTLDQANKRMKMNFHE